MSFKEHDKRTFIIDSANAYTGRRISKREFLRRMGLVGVGFSSFGLGMLGGHRRGVHGLRHRGGTLRIAHPQRVRGLVPPVARRAGGALRQRQGSGGQRFRNARRRRQLQLLDVDAADDRHGEPHRFRRFGPAALRRQRLPAKSPRRPLVLGRAGAQTTLMLRHFP